MDSNLNPEPAPKPPHHDIAEPGPIDPATGQPNRAAEVTAVQSWFRQNAFGLVVTAIIIGFVFKYWDPFTALKVALGLGFIIFIHELGHFLAAKWSDVHVKTFSIGFGPAIPFCSYKWGETTYMLGVIPLGGYVSMVGEGTGESLPDADVDDEDNDPRSFKNKSVWKRMLIISAGVIMNLIFGIVCFVAAYMHGVKEEPATVGSTSSGGAAWRAGLRDGDEIVRIGARENPTFKDLRPVVMSTDKGEQVPVVVRRNGREHTFLVEPIRDEGTYFPVLGVHADSRLVAAAGTKSNPDRPPVREASKAAGTGEFKPGDQILSMTDPANPGVLTKLANMEDYRRRMVLLAGQPATIGLVRKDEPADAKQTEVVVPPAFRTSFGLRMQMGKIAALRVGGPAEKLVQALNADEGQDGRADRIAAVGLVDAAGKKTWLANGTTAPPEAKPGDDVRPLDPVVLPRELFKWAAAFPEAKRKDLKVELVVGRFAEQGQEQRKTLMLDYDDSYRFERETLPLPNSPLPLDGLGLAYWVSNLVEAVEPGSPAEKADIRPGDVIEAIQLDTQPAPPNWIQRLFGLNNEKWDEIKTHHWAFVDSVLQSHVKDFKLRLKRATGETAEVVLKSEEDKRWPVEERGLMLQAESRIQKAADLGDAINLGVRRTGRFIREVYMNLYSMIRGRVSAKTLSGPLTIADVSYKIAGEDFWQFLIFLGVISVNLAVVNFLPVPVLDGGHFLFLVYEKVTGRPLPERLFAALMYIGLAMILTLFVFVISRDILRLYF